MVIVILLHSSSDFTTKTIGYLRELNRRASRADRPGLAQLGLGGRPTWPSLAAARLGRGFGRRKPLTQGAERSGG